MTEITTAGISSNEKSSATPARVPLFVAQPPAASSSRKQIKRVFIANRGEIACRIIATCRRLNLTSIAIYAEEDLTSRHVSEADEAISLGSISQAAGNPFLNIKLLVERAQSVKADAIHPGYGYLSENGDFADAIRKAGMIFVGPSSQAMATLGDKRNSKEYLKKHAPSIPLIPGFSGSSQNIEDLEAAAEEVGYPVMLKASAGGGGRGMRIVRERSKLREELERAQSEAQHSFGSSDCILEKYIEAAKHIEVQIIGDSHGKVLSLWERECSVQRRHQKVIEETPSPFLNPEQRKRMCDAAVKLGELISYEGAGTVEFVVDAKDGSFYFLEVNTRLQVEHPITEEVTGLDIVALQLYVAGGGRFADLPNLKNIPQNGHAIECRLCAEDPAKNFMPESGPVSLWKQAKLSEEFPADVRYETSVKTGSNVSIYFDSMIAKVVVWAPSRELAISKMVKVLADTACVGVRTNQLFLQSVLLHHSFHDPKYTTSLISTHLDSLLKNPYTNRFSEPLSTPFALLASFVLRKSQQASQTTGPFRNVRKAFRNQSWDKVNVNATVITQTNPAAAPLLAVWKGDAASATNDSSSSASVINLSDLSEVGTASSSETNGKSKSSVSLSEITKEYNAVSQKLRQGALTQVPVYQLALKKWQSRHASGAISASVEVTINGVLIHADVITTARSLPGFSTRGGYNSVACHFPSLGTWVEYQNFSLLSYFESVRDSIIANEEQAASQTIRAPMPCRVLSVPKKDGDKVETGETVLVIESMKMETSITSSVAGTFRTNVKQGDAVEDGKVLCWFE